MERTDCAGWLGIALAGCVAIGLATYAPIAEADTPLDLGWQPGLSVFTVGLPEDRSAEATSEAQGFQDGESVGFPWSVGGALELASPVLLDSSLSPRAFVHVGIGYVLDSDDPVSTVGDPGSVPFVPERVRRPESIENQGAAVRVQAKSWALTGGIGTQIRVEVAGRSVYLRPTLEWMYRRDTIQALLGTGEGEVFDATGNCAPCRLLFIDAEREKGYHSLGAGLDVSADSGRLGSFIARLYATFRVYHILGDRKSDLVNSGTWVLEDGSPSTRVPPTSVFTARYEREPLHYRVGVGLRLLWMPE